MRRSMLSSRPLYRRPAAYRERHSTPSAREPLLAETFAASSRLGLSRSLPTAPASAHVVGTLTAQNRTSGSLGPNGEAGVVKPAVFSQAGQKRRRPCCCTSPHKPGVQGQESSAVKGAGGTESAKRPIATIAELQAAVDRRRPSRRLKTSAATLSRALGEPKQRRVLVHDLTR